VAKRLTKEVVQSIPEVSKELEPSVYLMQLDGSTMNFEIVCWVINPALRRKVLDTINTHLNAKFKEKGLRFSA